jgi:hypothetical protein
MKPIYQGLTIAGVGACLATLLLAIVPKVAGLTYTTPAKTSYIRLDQISFWVVLSISLLLSAMALLRNRLRH